MFTNSVLDPVSNFVELLAFEFRVTFSRSRYIYR